MLEKDKPLHVPTAAEITAAQQGLMQLLAKAVAERLADTEGTNVPGETATRQ